MARIALQPFSYAIAFTAFFVTVFPSALIALPFNEQTRLQISAPFWKIFANIILRVSTFSQIYVQDQRAQALKSAPPKGLYIANHQSFVDIPLIISCFQIPPIMKKEILYIPILGLCAYAAGAMVVDRKNAGSRRKALVKAQTRLIQGIQALQVYPEGTRQKNGERPKDYNFIKKALLKFAYEKNIPVHPVSLHGTKRVINSKTGFINHGQKIGIFIKGPVNPSDFNDVEDFMSFCWNEVIEGHQRLQEKLT
ncbi:MAG: 1-acyl-sn-glycerol-3-phosphate acyltransferase [Bacteriovoracaceae bacterium]|nr:1-acyl-sn-glycerol-3-phosphate acyltransferase [Bacteriovoracaceae bacterium]